MKERLTKRESGSVCSYNGKIYYDEVSDIIERLAELEDKIERGNLIELPCAVGDKIWAINTLDYHIFGAEIVCIKLFRDSIFVDLAREDWLLPEITFSLDKIGELVFFTREEAEKKSKELKEKNR